jgi:SHS2 domain-containing protein
MGIRVRAATREGLIVPAASGLYAAVGELVADESRCVPFHFCATGHDDAVLLRDFLTELLVLFERSHSILIQVTATSFPPESLTVMGASAPIAPERCVFFREVKAVTYHDLELRRIADGFEAKLIVDI